VVTRRQKLIAAGAVLLTGFGLAWPLRRAEPLIPAASSVASEETSPQLLPDPLRADQPLAPNSPIAASVATAGVKPVELNSGPFAAVPALVTQPVSTSLADAKPLEPEERIHVVHQGDSLERLAKRYLSDEGRALEIFDLNRGVLDNPHLLPIGAELHIPAAPAVQDVID